MPASRKTEDRLLDREERELVDATRQDAIRDHDDARLRELVQLLRERRDRATRLANRQRRNVRGKGAGQESFDQADGGNRQKASVLQGALARLNKETARRAARAKRSTREGAERALSLKSKAPSPEKPDPGETPGEGFVPVDREKPIDPVERGSS